MSSFIDFNQRVVEGGNKNFVLEIKALLESTKAALDKEQSALSSAKKETATFADEVEGLKAKISLVEKVGNGTVQEKSENAEPEKRVGKIVAFFPEPDNVSGAVNKKSSSTIEIPESKQSSFIIQTLRSELKTKDDTMSTLVRTNAALSRQLEELRSASKEQEKAHSELLKLVDGVTAGLLGELPITKPTAFYIEERHKVLVAEIKSSQEKLKNMKDLNLGMAKELEVMKNGARRMEGEIASFRSRLSLAESQSQLMRSERDRALTEISDLNAEIMHLKNENIAQKDKFAVDVRNLQEEFKRKFKATVWSQSGMPGSKEESKNVEMVVWLDESVTVEKTKAKLRDSAANRDLSSMMAIMSTHNERAGQSAVLQELSCSLLADIALIERNQPDILASGILDAVLTAMRQHIDSLPVQEQAIKVLNILGSTEANRAGMAERCIGDLLLALRLHVEESQLQADCLLGLNNFCTESTIKEIIDYGLDDILRSMRKHTGLDDVERAAYDLLHLLTSDDEHAKAIGEKCLIEIVDSMRQQVENEGLQESACSVLCNLARDDDNRQAIMELGLADIFAAMRQHKGSAGVQEKACAALGNLAADDNNTTVIAEEGLADILEAMSQHMDRAGVVQFASTALWYLTTNPKQLERIAEFGLDIILTAVSNHMTDPEVLSQACGALLNLSLDPRSCSLMVNAGCTQTMQLILQEHGGNPEIDQLANRILTQLSKRT